MTSLTLSNHQRALTERPIESKIFLKGPAGTGKTTAGVGLSSTCLAPASAPGRSW